MKLLQTFWMAEEGFVVSSELILVATMLVIGMLTGLNTIRDQVVQELADVADAFSEINQSYSYSGITSHSGSTAGSGFNDVADFCEVAANGLTGDQSVENEPQCIEINTIAADVEGTP
jgi:hypothetical protein